MDDFKRILKFAVVGLIAFVLDWVVLSLILKFLPNFLVARALSFFSSLVFTFTCNKHWTFHDYAKGIPLMIQFTRFASAHMFGGVLNYSVSASLALTFSFNSEVWLGVALAAGSLSGMISNYVMTRRFVFQRGERDLVDSHLPGDNGR